MFNDLSELQFFTVYSRVRNKRRGKFIISFKELKKKRLRNDRNALIDVKMN